jgi:L-lactate dehydrogenase (cytochrome)
MGSTFNVVPVTPVDFRRLAEKRLPRFLFDYIDGGANEELTMARNVADFHKIIVKQNVLRDVAAVDTSTTLAGDAAAMPLALAPVGMAGLFGRRGEQQGVRAANAASVPFTLSTVGICPLEEVRAASASPFWFQLYIIKDRKAVQGLLERAMAVGCTKLAFTVDLPMPGWRHRDERNGMFETGLKGALARGWQVGTRLGWIYDVGVRGKPHTIGNLADVVPDPSDLNSYKKWIDGNYDRSVTWKDFDWVRKIWKGKILIKGILEPEDARSAVSAGADGVIVSNHGGRQLDSVASSISKLPAVVDAVGERIEVFMDGGVRSGLDVFKAVALGARGVFIGRPWVWALAGAGEAGVNKLLTVFKQELEVAMALNGVTRIGEIGRASIDSGL